VVGSSVTTLLRFTVESVGETVLKVGQHQVADKSTVATVSLTVFSGCFAPPCLDDNGQRQTVWPTDTLINVAETLILISNTRFGF